MKKIFYIKLTNGLGNNLFQIVSSLLLFKDLSKIKFVLIAPCKDYYALDTIKKLLLLNLDYKIQEKSPRFYISINDKTYNFFRFFPLFLALPLPYLSQGYFEDYRYYFKKVNLIRSYFSIKKYKLNKKNLILHLRTGDRLFLKDQEKYRRSVEDFNNIINSFKYVKLFIVTDFPSLDEVSIEELLKIDFHKKNHNKSRVFHNKTLKYINSLIKLLNSKNATHFSGTLYEEFCFLVSSPKIIFEHSTTAWWASFLSYNSEVRVSEGWRPWKGKANKNLSRVPLKNWQVW